MLVKSKEEKVAVFSAIEKLRSLGPQLPSPHSKSLKGHSKLLELRPRGGRSPTRPVYRRFGDHFVILAVASVHEAIDAAASLADARARQYERFA